MGSGLFKNRILPFSIVSLLFSTVSSIFLCRGILSFRDAYNKTSVYKNTEIDFIVPSPSEEQVGDLKSKSFISEVLPYYYTKTTIACRDKNIINNVMMFGSLSDIKLSPYNQNRCIDLTDEEENSMVVDYSFFSKTKCNLGDTASFSINGEILNFKITGIFEENAFYDNGAVAVKYGDAIKNAIMKNRTKNIPYSGAYISASNKEECKNYLYEKYKPLGLLKERDEFNSDEAYKIYITGFYSTNYSNEIVFVQQYSSDDYLDSQNLETLGYATLISNYIALPIVSILSTLIIDGRKKEISKTKQLIKNGEDKKNVYKYYLIPHLVTLLLNNSVICVALLISRLNSSYIRLLPCLTLVFIELLILLLCFSTSILISRRKVKSLFDKR